jgi:hypothetical protein
MARATGGHMPKIKISLSCAERAVLAVHRALSEAARDRVNSLLYAEWLYPESTHERTAADDRFSQATKTLGLNNCPAAAIFNLGRDRTHLERLQRERGDFIAPVTPG